MSTVTVKAHTRRKPAKPEIYRRTHEQLRAEVLAMKRVNEYRDEIGYVSPKNALSDIVDALRKLINYGAK